MGSNDWIQQLCFKSLISHLEELYQTPQGIAIRRRWSLYAVRVLLDYTASGFALPFS